MNMNKTLNAHKQRAKRKENEMNWYLQPNGKEYHKKKKYKKRSKVYKKWKGEIIIYDFLALASNF